MNIVALIPTVDRPSVLQTIESLKMQTVPVKTVVMVDGADKKQIDLIGFDDEIEHYAFLERMDYVRIMNLAVNYYVKREKSDAIFYGSDDLIFPPTLIEQCAETMASQFPDLDGLVCVRQDIGGCQYAFGLIGRRFIERFPDSNPFCPDFIHYGSDMELGKAAQRLKKYRFLPDCALQHLRPHDKTWKLACAVQARDHRTMRARAKKGYLWGVNFDLISPSS